MEQRVPFSVTIVNHYPSKNMSPSYCRKGCSGQYWILLFWAGVVWVVTNTVSPAVAQALCARIDSGIIHMDSKGHGALGSVLSLRVSTCAHHRQGELSLESGLGFVLCCWHLQT